MKFTVARSAELGMIYVMAGLIAVDWSLDNTAVTVLTSRVSMDDVTGTDWSAGEIDLIVADYFDMFGKELTGQLVNKAERNRALQELTGRSRGSIEFKHQNISAVLGRGLVNAQPQPYRRKLDEREVVGREFVVPRRDTPTVLDLVEEPLDQISRAVKMWAEAQCLSPISLRWDIRPGAALANKRPDPVCVISAVS